MAKFLGTAAVATISGSIAGTTFTKNGQMRTKSNPSNPSTQRQSFVRAMLAFLSQAWGNVLTQDQRDAWNNTNVTTSNGIGGTNILKGNTAFIQVNMNLLTTELVDTNDIILTP